MVVVVTPYNRYEVSHHHLRKSELLSLRAASGPSEIYLHQKFLKDNVFMRILSYLMGREPATEVPLAIEDDELLLALVLAADYLIIPELYKQYTGMLVDALSNCSSAQQLRDRLRIKNDFSEEEELLCRRENPWREHRHESLSAPAAPRSASPTCNVFVSMIVDDSPDFARTQYSPPCVPQVNPEQEDIVQFVQPRRPIVPVPDSQVSSCANYDNCKVRFSTINRKHHCRHCGRIFCAECSPKFVALPEADNVYHGYTSYFSWVASWVPNVPASDTHRVCNGCYESISEREHLSIHIAAFRKLALEIPLLKRAGTVCKSWRRAAIYCLSLLRELQYHLPTSQPSEEDRKQLWASRHYWAGHSKWLIQLMKAVNWNIPADASEAVDILLNHPKKYTCWQAMCSRSCTEFSSGDALLLLNEDMPNNAVRNFAVSKLDEASDDEFLCYIPLLVHDLRYFDQSINPLMELLVKRAVDNEQIANDLFWSLSTASESKSRSLKALYCVLQNRLIIAITEAHGKERATQLTDGQSLVGDLEHILPGDVAAQLKSAKFASKSEYEIPFPLPVDPLIKVRKIDWKGIIVKQSATAPIVVPCISTTPQLLSERTSNSRRQIPIHEDFWSSSPPRPFTTAPAHTLYSTPPHMVVDDPDFCFNPLPPKFAESLYQFRFMFKREDLRKDQIILNVIKAMDIIIKRELGCDFNVLTYRVVPTSSSNGILEIVDDSDTLFDVVKNYKTIQHFLTTNNGERQVDEVASVYMKSLAAWTVITHLLGVGDRHLDNIMITKSGIIFHIDYGFVLGKDPKPLAPNIRMSESMIDSMGGRKSKHYKEFMENCAKIFLCLRRYTPYFFNLLMMLQKADPPISDLLLTPKYLEEELSKRFLPGHSEAEAKATLLTLIDQCDTFGQYFTDFLHTHAKEKTIAEGVHKMAAGASAALGMVTGPVSYWMGWGSKTNN